jgi:hypothetical protein
MSLEINFIDYNKVTNTSDAFITCDELNCYVQYLSSTITTAPNIKKDKHTAGTTEDVHDFKIPDVKDKISPKKLKRINPFNKNHNEVVYLNKLRTDPDSIFPVVTKEIKTKEIDFAKAGLNQDQIDFLLALQNLRSGKIENDSKLLDIEQFQACKDKVENNFFDIGARFYESMISIGGAIGGFDEEVVEQTRTMDPAVNDYIKKYNLPQADTSVKKKFNVRKGNATGVNQYLQDSSKKTQPISKQSNTQDFKQINVTESTQKTTSPTIKLSNSQNYTYQSNILNSTHSNSLINNIKVSKVYNEEKQNFKDRYDDFVKLLNSSKSNQKVSFEIKNFNTKQYNNTEYKEVINLTERNTSSFVMNNLSSNYNFYREMNNRYSEFKTDFISYSTEVKNLTNFTIKNRNTINQLYKTQNTFRQSIMNVINNIRKIEKITFNENDNEFKYNILKFVKQSTFKIENTVSNVKNELNQTKNNISFVNHKLFRLENFKDEYFSKEVLNFLNTSENFVNLNRFASSTLNNYAKNNYTKTIQSLSFSENQINNIIKLSEIKNINNENIESITKVLNLKLGDNQINNLLNLSKIDNKIIQKISSISKIENINKNILNITEQEKIQTLLSSLNISQVQNLKMISTSVNANEINKIKNVINTTENIDVFNLSKNEIKLSKEVSNNFIQELNQISKVYNTNSNNFRRIVKINSINQQTIDNIEVINSISESKLANVTNQSNKTFSKVYSENKISNLNNNVQEISNLNLTTQQVKNIVQLFKISQSSENIFKVLNVSNNKTINSVVKLSNVENKNITQLFDVIEQVKKYDFSKMSTSKIDFSSLSQNINNLKTISQYDVKNISVIQNKISNFSDRRKLKETIELLNITTKNNIINPTVFKVTNSSQKKVLQENIQNINIFESGKNATVINKLSFESNKKNITNLVSDLNIVNNNIFEKRTSQNINQVYKELNLTNKDITKEIKLLQKEHRRIEKATNNFVRTISKQNNLATQNVYDYLSFTNNNFVSKTNIDSKYGDYSKIYTLLNNSKVINQYVKSTVEKVSNNVSQTRIVKQVENIRFDLHKTVQENNFKLENYNKITSNNYFEQKEVESKQEKIIETKVEQLLVKKIENVTNSLVKNVMTKNEFTLIKNEIVNEILQIQIKQEDKLKQFRLETQQTVQDMLERFLRS